MNFYFWVAFYSDGRVRVFNTKRKPRPVNRMGEGKLIEVKKFEHEVKFIEVKL